MQTVLMATWPYQSALALAAMPNAPYWARRHTEDVLAEWGLTRLTDIVCLVVSELVTNAAKATGELPAGQRAHYDKEPLSVPYRDLAGLGCVRLWLSYDRIRLLVEVWDKSDDPPVMEHPDEEAEGGRGLFLVGALCERWGWYPAEKSGKVVWSEFPADHSHPGGNRPPEAPG